jgi:HAE1 family hydrophobic/amphiphilic exporter-1
VKLSELSVKRPVTVLMMIFIVLILGFVSFTRIPLDLMPEMEIPVAAVMTTYSGVGPQEVEKLITKPLEEVIGSTENIDSLYSISAEGSSTVMIMFDFGVDMDNATLELREKIDLVKGYLPEDASDPMVFKFDPTAMPVMMLSLSAEGMGSSELQTLVEDTIKPRLERAEGIVSVEIIGGVKDIVEIRASSEKIQGYGISLDYLANILRAENFSMPGGSVQKGEQELTIKTTGEFQSVEEIQELLIPLPNGATVRLHDLAEVELKADEPVTISQVNGQNSIDMMLSKQSGTNTVKVSEAAHKEIEALQREIPGIKINPIYDTADYIKQSLDSVKSSAYVGGLLAIFVLYLFLRNLRTTFIIATSIPISIIATFCLIYFSGVTLNLMTLGGLALGVGMLVDNSIVVLENIYRFRQDGYSRFDSAVKGTSEVSMALIASTATTLAVFLPIVFVQGLTSAIFKQLAMTVSFSLLASLAVAMTLVPMLSSKFLRVDRSRQAANGFNSVLRSEGGYVPAGFEEEEPKEGFWARHFNLQKVYDKFEVFYNGLLAKYESLLKWALNHRKRVIVIATIAFFGSMSSIAFVGSEFIPATDEGYVQISVRLSDGAELEDTLAIMEEVEAKLQGQIPEIENVFLEAGYGGDMTGAAHGNQGTIYVQLTDLSERKRGVNEISDVIRSMIRDIPGAKISVSSMASMSMSGGTPISINIYGEDLDTLKMIGDDVKEILEGIEGTREVKSSYEDGIPEVEIKIERAAAAQYGLTASQIAQAVRGIVSGTTATKFKYEGTEIDVIIKGDEYYNENIQGLEQIPITTNLGFPVSLGQVAEVSIKRGPVSISREDQERLISVSCQLSGRDVGSVAADMEQALAQYQMPDRYYYKMGGEQQEMIEAFSDLGLALILAVILVYMVMASQFESLLYPFIIMFSMPLAFAGGIFGLFIAGTPLSVPAIIGLIILAGIVVNNAIVLVDYINTRRRVFNEDRITAITKAGPIRLRPILMTALTTILAMVPLTLGIGEGSEMSAPLAIVVVWGLTLSTLVTLVVIPVMYTILDDVSLKVRGKFKSRKDTKTVSTAGSTTQSGL